MFLEPPCPGPQSGPFRELGPRGAPRAARLLEGRALRSEPVRGSVSLTREREEVAMLQHPELRRRVPLSRREFLRRAGAAGIALPTLSAILAACGGDDGEATGGAGTTGSPSSSSRGRTTRSRSPSPTTTHRSRTASTRKRDRSRSSATTTTSGRRSGTSSPSGTARTSSTRCSTRRRRWWRRCCRRAPTSTSS